MLASRLVAQRMLVRTRDAADKRAVLHLTPHDRAACQRVLERVTGQLDPDIRTAADVGRT